MLAFAFFALAAVQVGPDSGLRKTTQCYLAESKRLAAGQLGAREIASKIVELCKEEIDLAALELFPGSEISKQKLIVSLKGRVVDEVGQLRSKAGGK